MTVEESFPRGGGDDLSVKRKRKFNDLEVSKTGAKRKRSGRLSEKFSKTSSDGVWTRKLTLPMCNPGILALGCVKEIRGDSLFLELSGGITAVAFVGNGSDDRPFESGQLLSCKVLDVSKSLKAKKRSTFDPVKVNLN